MAEEDPTPTTSVGRRQFRPRTATGKKVTKSKILVKEKQRAALELRKAGASYPVIARQLGYSDPSSARKAVITAYDEVIQEPAEESWQLSLQRLEYMLLKVWPKVQDANHPEHHWAVGQAVTLQVRIDALTGAEAPKKIEHEVTAGIIVVEGNKEEYIAKLALMAGDDVPVSVPVSDDVVVEAVEEEHSGNGSNGSYVPMNGEVKYIPLPEEE